MKIGFVGAGKLGLPCAVATAMKGHLVRCYDKNPELQNKNPRPYQETGPDGVSDFNENLKESSIEFSALKDLVEWSEAIFVAVQTPHEKEFEGITRIPAKRKDFNYDFLEDSIKELSGLIKKDTIVVIISTVLPGTIRERVMPHLNRHMKLCYNPFFIAMGTTMRDFLNPELVLFGVHDQVAAQEMEDFYKTIHNAPFFRTTIENAELIKVAYNTFIGMKIVFANTMMEICHHTENTNVDELTRALSFATNRILSTRYLTGGMGDGGGCHPRDNIALSYLARKLGLSCDWFESLMYAREYQTEWLADLMEQHQLPKAILGYSFKEESNITTGSPALLLETILKERGHCVYLHDPLVEGKLINPEEMGAKVFLIGTRHQSFQKYKFAAGSVVIDPWRYLQNIQSDITYIPVGRNSKLETQIFERDSELADSPTRLKESSHLSKNL